MESTALLSRATIAAITLAIAVTASCANTTRPGFEPPTPSAVEVCLERDLANGCVAGRCRVSAPPGTVPFGEEVVVEERRVPEGLAEDVSSPVMCVLTVPGDARVTLSIETNQPLEADTTMFRLDGTAGVAVPASTAEDSRVVGFVAGSGVFGVTRRPKPWGVVGNIIQDPLSSQDTPSLVRNISSQPINAAYYDGTRLYVGSGPRVLIYQGIPSSPDVRPAVVVGQPNIDTILSGTSSSILAPVSAIWSDGVRLVVANGQRVMIWNTIPTADFLPADLVLGQQDFTSNQPNAGGVSASTMNGPLAVDGDAARLVVADSRNHRVLAWEPFPTSIGQPATSVVGQASFTATVAGALDRVSGVELESSGTLTASPGAAAYRYPSLATNTAPSAALIPFPGGATRVRADGLTGATSVAKLSDGSRAIVDPTGNRIAFQRDGAAGAVPIDFVLGQADRMRNVAHPTCGSSVSTGARVIASGGVFLVPDQTRLLVYETPPTYSFQPADRVVGQGGFSTADVGVDHRRLSERSLAYPTDVAVSSTMVAVADRGNNRVVLYPKTATVGANVAATVIVGQPDAYTFVPNVNQVGASAQTLSGPSAVVLDDTRLIVADTENHRVLLWSPVPTTSGQPANVVLGQGDFMGRKPNRGRGDANLDGFGDADADGLFAPSGLATDGTRLFVADRLNHRILVWNDLGTVQSGKPADAVLGQPDFTSVLPNRGAAGESSGFYPRPDGLNFPSALRLSGTSLFVADTENNRIVRWDDVATTPTPGAFIGQSDGASLTNPNYFPENSANAGGATTPATTASSVLRPQGIAVSGTRVYVSERTSNRVHVFELTGTGSTPYAHQGQLGQPSSTSSTPNANGLSPSSLSAPSGLVFDGSRFFVADAANHRVLGYDATTLPSASLPATTFVGQASGYANGFDQSASATSGGATRPRGLSLEGGEMFIADAQRNRIIVHDVPLASGHLPKRLIGQADASVGLPNAGEGPTAHGLSSPRAVSATPTHVLVADTGNNRVLVFGRSSPSRDAVLVLGQLSFTETLPNRGGAATAGTMNAPEGVFTDGQRIVVADTGNHRVLVWATFPIANGEPAKVVAGQPSALDTAPNGGTGGPGPATMSGPSGVLLHDDALFVADTGNNRVLRFAAVPSAMGQAAVAIFGQDSGTTRIAAANANDVTRLGGPVAMATDGTNLYVTDRDVNRVVTYALGAATGTPASLLFNANTGLVASSPSGIAAARTPLFSTTLWVSDTSNERILLVDPVSRLGGL